MTCRYLKSETFLKLYPTFVHQGTIHHHSSASYQSRRKSIKTQSARISFVVQCPNFFLASLFTQAKQLLIVYLMQAFDLISFQTIAPQIKG